MPSTRATLDEIVRLVAGARLWGLELEPRWRVLAATLEPTVAPTGEVADGAGADGSGADGRPGGDKPGESDAGAGEERAGISPPVDRRLQLLLFPVTRFAVRLTRDDRVVERFDIDLLPDVAAALDGPRLHELVFDPPSRRRPRWGGAVSVEGSSNAPDGRAHVVALDVRSESRRLELEASFDDVRLRTADGRDLLASDGREPPHGAG